MPFTVHRRRLTMRVLAVLLAGLYGLLASVGDGLHLLVHLTEARLAAAWATEEDPLDCGLLCSCDHGAPDGYSGHDHSSHSHSHSHRPAADHTASAGQPRATATAADAQPGPKPHEHDCAVCQLLGQLRHAALGGENADRIVWATSLAPPPADTSVRSLSLLPATARGPPCPA